MANIEHRPSALKIALENMDPLCSRPIQPPTREKVFQQRLAVAKRHDAKIVAAKENDIRIILNSTTTQTPNPLENL